MKNKPRWMKNVIEAARAETKALSKSRLWETRQLRITKTPDPVSA